MSEHKKALTLEIIPLVIMAILSLTPLIGTSLSYLAVIFGLVYFFVYRRIRKVPFSESGLTFKSIPGSLKNINIWLWMLLPIGLDIISVMLSKAIVPDYLTHVLGRIKNILSLDHTDELIFQIVILAVGEEIAFRAFFQNILSKNIPYVPAVLITSLFFAICHTSQGSIGVVIYDLIFVFLDSIIYGVIFRKTQNAYVSSISHILANAFGIIMLLINTGVI